MNKNLSVCCKKNRSRPELNPVFIYNKAFTLIELLVVIVIIGILATIGIAQFNSYAVTSRDAKRMAEFSQIEKHILTHTIGNGVFPSIAYEGGVAEPDCGTWFLIAGERQDIIEGLHITDSAGKINCVIDIPDTGTAFYIYQSNSTNWCSDTSKLNGRYFVVITRFEEASTRDKFSFQTADTDGLGCEDGLYRYASNGVMRVFHEGNYQ